MGDAFHNHQRRWLWVPAQGRDDEKAGTTKIIPAARKRPSFEKSRPREGAGKAGCRLHPWVPCNKKHGGRTTGSTGITPTFPAQWFTAYPALSPVTGLFCHRRPKKLASQELYASIGASGPHGFAVRVTQSGFPVLDAVVADLAA